MTISVVKHPDKIVSTGAYSAGIICDGWLYVSGHASHHLKAGEVISGSTAEETGRTLMSIGKILKEAGFGNPAGHLHGYGSAGRGGSAPPLEITARCPQLRSSGKWTTIPSF